MQGVEERRYTAGAVELRGRGDAGQRIAGYAARFNVLSDDLGGFREIIDPGFFDEVMGDDVRALWQHDARYVFGRTGAGTLRLTVDDLGLAYEADAPDTSWARDAIVSIERGDVNQSSFGFDVAEDAWESLSDGTIIRRLLRAGALYDVSPVTFPAYPQTTATARDKASALRAQAGADGGDDEAAENGTGDGEDDAGRRRGYHRNRLIIMELEQ